MLIAPFAPFIAEEMYQNLVRSVDDSAAESVHMAAWPAADETLIDDDLLAAIAVVQKVVGLGRAARSQSGVRTRQPLGRLLVRAPSELAMDAVREHAQQIREELNIKTIEPVARDASLVDYRIKPNLPVVGRKFGKLVPKIKLALGEADGERIATAVANGETFTLDVDGQTLELGDEDCLVETASAEGYASAEEGGYLVGLDTSLDESLIREGLARELIRTVQEGRKQAGLEVSDRIVLGITGSADVEDALGAYRELLMSETLADRWQVGQSDPFTVEGSLEDSAWRIEISRI